MKSLWASAALLVSLSINGAAQIAANLHGVVTDPSGASVPGALVQLRGPGMDQRATTGANGAYAIEAVKPGKYTVRFLAKGFTLLERKDVEIVKPTALDAQLVIAAETQVVNVEAEANSVSADTAENGDALVLKEKELAALSDDPGRAFAAIASAGRSRRRP